MTDDLIGKNIDGYRIEGELGRGGMGVVYRAKDVNLSRSVAIKRINPSQAHREQFIHRFRAEAKALARIDSPNIVGVYALRETDHGLFIVMEFVDGGTLHDRIDGAGPVPFDEAMPILRQILEAMSHAHSAGVIHRDLKPHNILLTRGDTVKITDFGIAKMRQPETEETVTQGGEGGTLTYMSPEQISDIDAVDDRSDLYSIGMVAYGMLAGRLPFEPGVPDFDIMRKVVEGDIPPPSKYNSALPDPLVRWMMRAIAKRQDDRYQSASAMLGALQEVQRIIASEDDGTDTGVNLSIGTPLVPDASPTQYTAPDDETVLSPDAAESGAITDPDADTAVDPDADTAADTAADPESDPESDAGSGTKSAPSAGPSAHGGGLDGPTVLDTGLATGDPASDDPASDDPASDDPASDEPASDDTAPDDPASGVAEDNRTLLDRAASAGQAATDSPSADPASADPASPDPASPNPSSADPPSAEPSSSESSPSERSARAPSDRAPSEPSDRAASSEASGTPRWMAVAAGVIAVLGIGAGAMWMTLAPDASGPAASDAASATLTLTSTPAGAAVYVDGDSVGTTPLSEQTLAAGAVVLRLQKPGYAPVDTALRVDAGASVLLRNVQLPPSGPDAADADASDADVADADATNPESGNPGAAVADASDPTASDRTATDRTASDSPESDPAESPQPESPDEPEPEPAPEPAQLTIETEAQGTVLVDGVEKGAGGTFDVAPGRRAVTCRHPQHGRIDTTLTFGAGGTQALACYFEHPLSVTTRGPWGNVWIDGQNTGASTPHTLQLSPGRHTVELRIARSDDFRVVGGAYRARAGDVDRVRESFQGASHVVTVRPGFDEVRHAVAFDVE